MNFSFCTSRRVNDRWQKCVVSYVDAPSTVTSGEYASYTKMKTWVNLIASLDDVSWTHGDLLENGMSVFDSEDTSNTGNHADVTFTVANNGATKPKVFTFTLKNLTTSNFVASYNQMINKLMGTTTVPSTCIVTSASFNINK